MGQQQHIINRQIIEVQMPKTADVHEMQQEVSRLYQEKLLPAIDQQLSDHYGSDAGHHYQVERLDIDLGAVRMEDIATVFTQKLAEAITSSPDPVQTSPDVQQEEQSPQNTPLKVLAHYLATGILPWWVEGTAKTYLHEQFDELLETPETTFKALIAQLPHHDTYLDRFLNTFTEKQVLQSLQLLTAIPLSDLSETRDRLVALIRKNPSEATPGLTDARVAKAFWIAVFGHLSTAGDLPELKGQAIRQALQTLGADPAHAGKWPGAAPVKTQTGKDLQDIRSLAEKLKKQHTDSTTWQRFFQRLSGMLGRPSIHLASAHLLKELMRLLNVLNTEQDNYRPAPTSEQEQIRKEIRVQLELFKKQDRPGGSWAAIDDVLKIMSRVGESQPDLAAASEKLNQLISAKGGTPQLQALAKKIRTLIEMLEASKSGIGSKAAIETLLQPLAKHLHLVEATMKQMQPLAAPQVIEQLQSEFEDTDFIPVQNAGLVMLWPFLTRFLENLDLVAGKAFHDQAARDKAVCALQYLCSEEEEALFEGMLPLNKVLCGIPLEDTVEPVPLSPEEKEIAEGLLHSVISRGPYWKDLTLQGFRSSYLNREGLLKTRDGHWLLQVKKETYDVTLEKLPWGFTTVKLPWMSEALMVEWI